MARLFYHTMQDNMGNLLFGVSGTMRLAGTSTPATIYGDEALTVVLPNPMTNHPTFGSFKCYVGVGDYDFYMAKSGYTFETLTGLQGYGTMADQDASNVIITGGSATLTGGVFRPNTATGDNQYALYSELDAAGGAQRFAINSAGDAPSYFNGNVQVQALLAVQTVPNPLYAFLVAGNARLGGPVAVDGLLSASAGATIAGTVTTNNLSASGPVTLGSTLAVSGNITANAGATVTGTITTNALGVTGAATIGSTLAVSGAISANAGATVTGLITTNSLATNGLTANSVGVTGTPGTLNVSGSVELTDRVGIGGPASSGAKLFVQYPKATEHGLMLRPTADDTGTASPILFLNVAAEVVGSIQTNATTTAYFTTSDARLKHDIAPMTGALALVQRLKPVTHRWKADDSCGYGLLAHELQRELPEAVSGQPDAVQADGSIEPQQVDYSKLVPWLVGAIQELAQRHGATEGA